MNRLTRITAILTQLQSKKNLTAKEIAKRFEVSSRTIYRDIKTLQDAGVPISFENGIGYFIVDGYNLPPIALTQEEANTLIILEKLIKKQGDKSVHKNFNSFIIKIKATLKNFQKENIELLASRTFSFEKEQIIESKWLIEIQKSISTKTVLEITYNSIYKQEITNRNIEPLAVCFTNNVWTTIAYCQLRKDIREFRLDRICKLITTLEPFKSDNNFNFQNYLENYKSS